MRAKPEKINESRNKESESELELVINNRMEKGRRSQTQNYSHSLIIANDTDIYSDLLFLIEVLSPIDKSKILFDHLKPA